jgi:hypothetical protein
VKKIVVLVSFVLIDFSLAFGSADIMKTDIVNKDLKIDSYKMDDGVGAWADDEARPLLKQTVSFSDKGMKLGKKFCAGKLLKLGPSATKDLVSDLKGLFCGKGKLSAEVYSIDLSCDDSVRFTPYVAKLSDGQYLGFGDGITFCLTP